MIGLEVLYGAGGLIAVLLFAYLVFALICAEVGASGSGLLALFLVVLLVLAWPVGRFLAALCDGRSELRRRSTGSPAPRPNGRWTGSTTDSRCWPSTPSAWS